MRYACSRWITAVAVCALAALAGCGRTSSYPVVKDSTTAANAPAGVVAGLVYLGTVDDCRLYRMSTGELIITAPMSSRLGSFMTSPACGVSR